MPSGLFALMPRGGDYCGFGLRGQECRKRFDLRAEAEPPSPSARVTHRGCGWEVDPERGLNQATRGGGGGLEGGGKQVECGGGDPEDALRPGAEAARAAGLRPAPALHPLPGSRDSVGAVATGPVASNGCGGRWRGVPNAPPVGAGRPAEGARRSQ